MTPAHRTRASLGHLWPHRCCLGGASLSRSVAGVCNSPRSGPVPSHSVGPQPTAHIHPSVRPILSCPLDVFFLSHSKCRCCRLIDICVSLSLQYASFRVFVIFDLSSMLLASICDVCSVPMLTPIRQDARTRSDRPVRQWTRTIAFPMATFHGRQARNQMWPPPRKLPQSSNCVHCRWSAILLWPATIIASSRSRLAAPVPLCRWLRTSRPARRAALSVLAPVGCSPVTIKPRNLCPRKCYPPRPALCPCTLWC